MGQEIKFGQTVAPEKLKALLIRLADALTDTGAGDLEGLRKSECHERYD